MLLRNYRGCRFAVGALVLLALAAVLSGCGGSDEPEALTRADFISEANAICVEAQDQRKQGTEELSENDGGDESEADLVTEALIGPVAEMTEELSELGPPKGEDEQVGEMIGAFEAGVAKLEAEPVSADSASAFTRASKLAADYGLPECAI